MRTALRVVVLVLAVGVVAMGAVTLNAQAAASGWKACPKPACMLPCSIDPPPEVLCKDKDGGTYVVNDKTTIMDNSNKTIDLGGLKTGWWVAVTVDTVTGKNVATYIEVVDTP